MFIEKELRGGLMIIRLNRPEKFNAFNRDMALQLQEALQQADKDVAVRGVMITGNGKAFSAGQDLGEVTGNNPMPFTKILKEHYNPIITLIRNLQKPVVAAVNGVAAGAGANIALCCDIVLASSNASFIQAFSKIGLIPDSGGTFFLPRLVGFQRASALALLGDKLNAEDAERMGLIYRVYDAAIFEKEAELLAQRLCAMPTRALALAKQALNNSAVNNLEQQLILEDELQLMASQTSDYREGVNAFLEKREPVFTGQ